MTSSGNSYPVILNQFCVKTLEEEARLLYPFTCRWQQNPELGTEAYALNKVCYQLPVPAARWGSAIVTRQPLEQLKTKAWQLIPQPSRVFDCTCLEQNRRAFYPLVGSAAKFLALLDNPHGDQRFLQLVDGF
ncbi:hypothetical protein L5220_09760 [Synechococcus sp. PCC 6716]|nr:hypothetical protein [Synechococcus sp. PCC 6716]